MPSPILSRRRFFHAAGLSSLALTFDEFRALAQEKQPPAPALAPLNRFPRMVQEWYVEQVRAAEKIGDAKRGRSSRRRPTRRRTSADVREKIAQCFGPFPEKTPLNAKVTGKVERDAYTIEKVDLREPAGVPRHRQPVRPEGREGPAARASSVRAATRTTARREPAYQSFARAWPGWATSC